MAWNRWGSSIVVAFVLSSGQGCGTTISLGPACGGRDVCGGACLDMETDSDNCGECGNVCSPGTTCSGGVCGAPCGDGLIVCDGTCVDPGSDPKHCGSCGVICPGGVCTRGVCGGFCPPELTACGDICTDIGSDPSNCGACFVPCSPAQTCSFGVCQCSLPGAMDCGGVCVDPATDNGNCGGCFIACEPDFSACMGGLCQPLCGFQLTYCAGICTDPLEDAGNCGGCGIVCPNQLGCFGGSCKCVGVPVTDLGSVVPQGVVGNTSGLLDTMSASCAGFGSPETVYSFTAPADGSYDFDTVGSSYAAALYILDGGCFELACNAGGPPSKISVPLKAGEPVYVVVDGIGGEQGPFQLNVAETGPCPAYDLGSAVPQNLMGNTNNDADLMMGSCVGFSGPEATYAFTAPVTGSYTIDTIGSAYDTVLYVQDGACGGPELACDDDSGGGLSSKLTVMLVAGQMVVIAVDGFGSGDFVLNIQ